MWAVPLKNKNCQIVTNEFSNILTTSKRSPGEIESERGAEFYDSIFQSFLNAKNMQHSSRFTGKSPSIIKSVIRTVRNLLEKPVFEKRNANWLFEQYNNTTHSSVKMTPTQASKQMKKKSFPISKKIEKFENQYLM